MALCREAEFLNVCFAHLFNVSHTGKTDFTRRPNNDGGKDTTWFETEFLGEQM